MATIRPATTDDTAALAETVSLAFERYREWAPRGWDPPPPQLHLIRLRDHVGKPGTWCEIALDGRAIAGHAAFTPARTREEPRERISGLAYLWMLFLREPWWGTGLAAELLARTIAEATAQGYRAIRLETPAAHCRARAFYEREGWRVEGEPFLEPAIGLELVEYRRELG